MVLVLRWQWRGCHSKSLIVKRSKSEWRIPSFGWFLHIFNTLFIYSHSNLYRYCNPPLSLLQEAQEKLLAMKAAKREPAPETQLNCINSLLWYTFPSHSPLKNKSSRKHGVLMQHYVKPPHKLRTLDCQNIIYRSFNHIEWYLSLNLCMVLYQPFIPNPSHMYQEPSELAAAGVPAPPKVPPNPETPEVQVRPTI